MFRILAFTLLSVFLSNGLQAKTFKIATEYPDGNSVLNELRAAGKRIEAQTENRIKFKFYPGGVMGDAVSVQRKIRIGQLQGTFIHSGGLASSYKDSQALNAPMLFRNFEEVDAIRAKFDGEFNQGFKDNGWLTYGLIEGGFAYAMTSVPVADMATLKQQKLWLPSNDPLTAKIAKSFGISPIVLNIGDVLTGLQTGAINAIVAPPVGAITLQWYSQTSHLIDAPFMYTYGVIALTEKAFAGVTDADRQILNRELTLSSQTLDGIARADNLKAFSALESLGIEIVPLESEARATLEREASDAVEKLLESNEFDRDLYNRLVAALTQYRSEL